MLGKRLICCLLVAALLAECSLSAIYALDEHRSMQESNRMWQEILDAELVSEPSVISEELSYDYSDLQMYINDLNADIAKEMDFEVYGQGEKEIDTEYLGTRFIISYRLDVDIDDVEEPLEYNKEAAENWEGNDEDLDGDKSEAIDTEVILDEHIDTEITLLQDYSGRRASGSIATPQRSRGTEGEAERSRKSLNEARQQINGRMPRYIVSAEEIVGNAAELDFRTANPDKKNKRYDKKLRVETNELMTAQDVYDKIYQEGAAKGVESELGNLPFTAAAVASVQAAEAVKVLLGRSDVISGKLLTIDLLAQEYEIFEL